jgi:hypothetical protein
MQISAPRNCSVNLHDLRKRSCSEAATFSIDESLASFRIRWIVVDRSGVGNASKVASVGPPRMSTPTIPQSRSWDRVLKPQLTRGFFTA